MDVGTTSLENNTAFAVSTAVSAMAVACRLRNNTSTRAKKQKAVLIATSATCLAAAFSSAATAEVQWMTDFALLLLVARFPRPKRCWMKDPDWR